TKEIDRLSIPTDNSKLDSTWEKKRIDQDADEKITNQVHRFDDIFSFSDRLLLFESCREKEIWHAWLLDLKKKEVLIFSRKSLYGDYRVKVKGDLFFRRIPGSYENGIIGAFDDSEAFNRHKDKYPLLKDLQFNADENPILVFFEFNR
ncbi:MAG: hypothetical protein GY940_02240, partial [bacterium]|nr:hypothetical protein [bacterium]